MFFIVFVIIVIVIMYILFSVQNTEMTNNQKINNSESTVEKVIVKFKGEEYDITDFVKKHPGGKQVLLENNGSDIEKLMIENEHSAYAYNTLQKYKINK
ncbi:cytochrome b5-like protein [Tupanvirus deep ocean]|uniref:Cytochrome b5-like protein n=2 Tax=Tupanvirus TaxID=2094720 RepID=A0AC62A748_9VIRU|nr:cytochrome b5-like protein [Tupanvirus deep ocean]QKU33443.1 cytochrome b5-like protein [Tupanvirus deep ocean]